MPICLKSLGVWRKRKKKRKMKRKRSKIETWCQPVNMIFMARQLGSAFFFGLAFPRSRIHKLPHLYFNTVPKLILGKVR